MLGFAAIAAANAVTTSPAPAPVIERPFLGSADDSRASVGDGRRSPSSTSTSTTSSTSTTTPAAAPPTTVDDHGGARGGHGTDDGPGHDVGDDHGSGGHGSDDAEVTDDGRGFDPAAARPLPAARRGGRWPRR